MFYVLQLTAHYNISYFHFYTVASIRLTHCHRRLSAALLVAILAILVECNLAKTVS